MAVLWPVESMPLAMPKSINTTDRLHASITFGGFTVTVNQPGGVMTRSAPQIRSALTEALGHAHRLLQARLQVAARKVFHRDEFAPGMEAVIVDLYHRAVLHRADGGRISRANSRLSSASSTVGLLIFRATLRPSVMLWAK